MRQAAAAGANIVLLQELFQSPYFCQEQKGEHYQLAAPLAGNPLVARFAALAKELGVVLPSESAGRGAVGREDRAEAPGVLAWRESRGPSFLQ